MNGFLEDEMRSKFGVRLHVARRAAGFSRQTSFASALGVSPSRLSQWERGKRMPDMIYLGKICTITGVTLDWLYFGNAASMPYGMMQRIHALQGGD
ncbi:helix-turn-helix transcriptional regulator [Iodidimonas sp. SYSU 1G8]|uniref:helix-turn-helix domain-containing protein n=1 Tax=Iodidimonas sp. SYSU 1G8 TaxID=3133967 RepID=UPI0031FE8F73